MPRSPKPPESFKRLTDFTRKIMAVPKEEVDELIRKDKQARADKKRAKVEAGT